MAPRLKPRTTTYGVLAVACVVSVATGAFTGVGSAAPGTPAGAADVPPGNHQAAGKVATTCPFADPVGPLQLTMDTAASLPGAMVTGKPANIENFSVTFTLPQAAARQLVSTGTALQGGLTLDLALEQGKVKDTLPVPLTIAATPLPADSDVSLTATGKLPPISLDTAGMIRIRLTAPKLALGAAPEEGVTDQKPAEQVTCTADSGQDLSFGSIPVLAAVAPPGEPAPGGTPDPKADGKGKRASASADDPPPDENVTMVLPLQPNQVDNTATILKTGTKIRSKPAALVNGVWVQVTTPEGFPISSDITGSVAFAPIEVSYLGYGFLPTTATVEFLPVDYRHSNLIPSVGTLGDGVLSNHIDVISRLSNVTLNGVPLDAGPDCVSERPIPIDMVGEYSPFTGGFIRTDPNSPDPTYRGFSLPPFKNCGVAEPLSAVFTGQTSGPGNQATANLTIIPRCGEADHRNCPPVTPIPASAVRASR